MDDTEPKAKNPHAAALGSLGGQARARKMRAQRTLSKAMSKAGKARMKSMTAQQRKQIASKAAQARWAKARKENAK
jgi:hypothetical protein